MKKIILSGIIALLIGMVAIPLGMAMESIPTEGISNSTEVHHVDEVLTASPVIHTGSDLIHTQEISTEDEAFDLEIDEEIDEAIDEAMDEDSVDEISDWAEDCAENAQAMAEKLQAHQQKLQAKMKDMEAKTKDLHLKIKERIQKKMPKIHQFHHPLAMMKQLDLDIEMPEIPAIPEIPPIPAMPAMPSIKHISQIDENFHGEIVKDVIEKAFAIKQTTPVRVDSIFSSIRIEPSENNSEIVVSLTKKAGADTKETALKLLELIQATVEQTAEAIEVHVQFNKKGESLKQNNTMMHSEIVIHTPVITPLELRNSFGDVVIQKIQGDIRSENKFGNTFLTETQGILHLDTQYGQLTVQDHVGNGFVRGQFGDVNVDKMDGDLQIEVGYGKTRLSTELNNAQIDGKFSFGETQINLPGDYSGRIEAKTSFSEIKAPESLAKKKKMFNESVEGDLGTGKGRVLITGNYSPIDISLGKNLFEKAMDLSKTVTDKVNQVMGTDKPTVRCEGVVLDAKTGKPIPNAKVEAYYMDKPPYSESTTDEEGDYRLKVFAEEHKIKASAPGYAEKIEMVDTGFLQRKKQIKINFLLDPK